jgi:hypothetical protein
MKHSSAGLQRSILSLAAAFLGFATLAQAGPPLICHAIQIGQAKSLPWVSEGWNLSGQEDYNLTHLVPDTLAILIPHTAVLVRMETLRRATIYAQQDPQVAAALLAAIRDRATTAEAQGHADALAWFDAGYLVEAYKQANWLFEKAPGMIGDQHWVRSEKSNPATGLEGYAWVAKAISLRGDDAEMEFAAALITLEGQPQDYQEHVSRAMAGAQSDPLLAQNLAARFSGNKGETISEMLGKVTTAKNQP